MAQVAQTVGPNYADYLDFELSSPTKHEFHAGQIFAMAGGTRAHAHLCTRLSGALLSALGRRPCRPFNSELRIFIADRDESAYPDASVICGKLGSDPRDKDAATNPSVLFEVLSPTTEKYDREGKFALYRQIPSLRDYVLVSQEHNRVEHFARNDDGSWTFRPLEQGEVLSLTGAPATLSIDELYQGIDDLREAVG